VLSGPGKPDLPGSSDPAFRGDASRYNPEELLVGSLASGHFTKVVLRPRVTIARGGDAAKARAPHESAGGQCNISCDLRA
jgi:organic hydroperoxide reductase OsmC/OhrA